MLVVLVIMSQAGCELARDDEVRVLLPAPPVLWQIAFPRMGFRVIARDEHNALRETRVDDWREPALLTCARRVNTPVLAFPVETGADSSRTDDLRPAGGFYPLSLRALWGGEVLALTWEDGAAADLLSHVVAQGLADLSLFNVARLRRFLQAHPDPWALDLDAVAQKISQGELTAWDIDALPCRDAAVEPGPGTWFLESPFSPSYEAVNGRITLAGVSLGRHRLYPLLGGRSWKMEIAREETILIPDP